VGCTDGVDAYGFKCFQPAFPGGQGNGDTQGSTVLVQANAQDFSIDTVEVETSGGFKVEAAYAEGGGNFVNGFVARHDGRDGGVQVGLVDVPPLRFVDGNA